MTSAVITSPMRISERFRDSSNRAAKDSDIQFPNFVEQASAKSGREKTGSTVGAGLPQWGETTSPPVRHAARRGW
jgi:hypothetical protein